MQGQLATASMSNRTRYVWPISPSTIGCPGLTSRHPHDCMLRQGVCDEHGTKILHRFVQHRKLVQLMHSAGGQGFKGKPGEEAATVDPRQVCQICLAPAFLVPESCRSCCTRCMHADISIVERISRGRVALAGSVIMETKTAASIGLL